MMHVRKRWIPKEKCVICCWQQEQEQVGRKVPLICPVTAVGRLICCCRYSREVWERKCKTNPVRLSGLPTDPGGPIYTDPLPPNVPSSEQKHRTDAALVCLHVPSVYRRTDGLRSRLGQGSMTHRMDGTKTMDCLVTISPDEHRYWEHFSQRNPSELYLRHNYPNSTRTPAAVGIPRCSFYKRVVFFSGGGTKETGWRSGAPSKAR